MNSFLRCFGRQVAPIATLWLAVISSAQNVGPIEITVTNGEKSVDLPLIPGVDEFKVLRTRNLSEPFLYDGGGSVSGYRWTEPLGPGIEFYRLELEPKDAGSVLAATVLNRLAYGPTPDEIERIMQMGADAYIREQLAPEKIVEDLAIDRVVTGTDWQYVSVTGTASSSTLYIYQTVVGDVYIDDLKLVRGTVAESGVNVLVNGDFESGLTGWTLSANVSGSVASTAVKHGGNSSLHLISSRAGSSQSSSLYRANLGLAINQVYTLSYWYKPGTSRSSGLTIRLSGSGIASTPDSGPGQLATKLAEGTAVLNDLAAWHVLHAIQSRKQLLETMLQFVENHFVTQHRKSSEYLDRYYSGAEDDQQAANLEYRELQRWRAAFLNPECTFHDLLKISAESPAMIIYLDTVNSRGNGANIANENYARELLELYTFGVDNGYDQNDITMMSRAWTGWSIRLVDPENEFNPFALQTTKLRPGGTNVNTINNLEGLWAFAYKPANHYLGEKTIFPNAVVPARFGPPYAGRNYELRLASGGAESDWQYVTFTGTASSSLLYMYITGVGDCYIDDLKIVRGTVPEAGANLVRNGDFETTLSGWTVSNNLRGSGVTNNIKHSGNGALHIVSTSEGSTQSSSIYQDNLGLVRDQPYTLSYWYKPGSRMNGNLVLRLSGRGIDSSPGGGTNSIQEGYQVLAHLADQPFTQEFISVKLCRLFVHDDFATGYDFTNPNLSAEGRLVRACMDAWEQGAPKGQIRKVLEVIFNSELFRSQDGSMQKVKTPLEFTVSAIRALRAATRDGTLTADSNGLGLRSPMNRMGRMRLFDRDDPDGYPESGAPWISAGTLAERLRFVQALLLANDQTGKADASGNTTDPVRLLKDRLPATAWNDPAAVADFFLGLIYPGEGKANLDDFRTEAIGFLNTADNGSNSPFSALVNTAATYDTRVRGMVAGLMSFQRFQEQ